MATLKAEHEYAVLPLSSLREYDNNPNAHSEKQIAEIVKSIEEFGFTNPILVDETQQIIAGHGRYRAATLLEYDAVPCIILRGLSDTQKRAYVIADNALPKGSVWDEALLESELEFLQEADFDLDLIGIDYIDLDEFNPTDFQDGHASDPSKAIEKTGTKLQIGEYSIPLPREIYIEWQDQIRGEVGFEKSEVLSEILRRLGICLDS